MASTEEAKTSPTIVAPLPAIVPHTDDKHSVKENEPKVVEHYGSLQDDTTSEHNEKYQQGGAQDAEISAAPAGTVVDVEEEEDTSHHIHGIPLILLAFGLCVTTFLIGLDQMIIATAIPKITTQFQSLDDVGWYGSSYLLTTTALQPTFGKVYTYFNIKFTFIIALAIFEVGSIICAAATGSKMLIVGRAIAGSGAAGLFSGGMTMVGFAVPLRRRPLYIAALSSMFGVSSIVGPILGGVFTDQLTWRWCFWINLPFGAVAILTTFFFFKNPERDFTNITLKAKLLELDPVGATFLISAIVCLLLALQWGGLQYPWNDSKVIGCFVGFGVLITIFITTQIRLGESATIPVRIFKQRTIRAVALTLMFMSMGLFVHIYYLPFYFQAVKGTSAEQSGIRVIPYLVSNTIFAIISGACVTVLGYYTPFIWFGTALFAIGSGLIYTFQVGTPHAKWIGYQIMAGGGSGAAIQLPFIAVQVVLSSKEMPTGNAVAIFFNSLGGAIAISIATNIFNNALKKQLPIYAPGIPAETIIQAGATNIRTFLEDVLKKPEALPGVLEAYNKALTQAYILPIAVAILSFLGSLLFEWKSVKGKKLGMAAPA
ncbi:DNA repair protein RAD50 [Microthyrium microscopicum]|uniref:DNA repair protein RAD50 n=1 Tax=Microthyrium microscopicum TaxID=703497 RepID=A0A6A6U9Z5_9PEZI|nr:DNA repair protein RAD50 [Microthyrium microscopicum]